MLSWRSWPSDSTATDTTRVNTPYTLRHFIRAIAAFTIALLAGTAAFAGFLNESGLQAFYRSMITLSLTGIDTKPQGPGGILATILLVLAGMAIYGYLASAIVELIAHGVLTGTMAERRRRRVIERMSDHYIVCGFGRVGREVVVELRAAGVPFVVLDFNPDVLEIAREQNVPFIEGSGTKDEDLEAAGLERARGLVAASDSDVDNLYIVVSARSECPDMTIVARASTEDAARRGGPGRAAVRERGPGDRQADAEAAGLRVPRHRLAARRPRSPLRGDR